MPQYFLSSTAATTVTTANKLTTTSGTETSKTSKTGKSTGWGVLWAQGNTGTWAAGASEPAFGDVHGFLLDDTSLEGKTISAGTHSVSIKLSTSSGAISGSAHVRIGKRSSAGVFTEIINVPVTVTSLGSTAATLTGSGTGSATSFTTGDKLYVEVELDITSTSSSSTTATTSLFENGAAESVTVPALSVTYTDSASGTLALSGATSEAWTNASTANGTLQLTGSATNTLTRSDSATGTITFGGSSNDNFTPGGTTYTDTATGTITVSGSASEKYTTGKTSGGGDGHGAHATAYTVAQQIRNQQKPKGKVKLHTPREPQQVTLILDETDWTEDELEYLYALDIL